MKKTLSEIKKFIRAIKENSIKSLSSETKTISPDLGYLQSLKEISEKVIVNNAKKEEIDLKSTDLVIRKCHEALNNCFLSNNKKYGKNNDKKYITIIKNYLDSINNINLYSKALKTLPQRNNNTDINLLDEIKYDNLKKAYESVDSNEKKIESSYKDINSLTVNGKNKAIINLIYKNDNNLYIKNLLDAIGKKLHLTKIPAGTNSIICKIKSPINRTAILYYRFILRAKKLIQSISENKDLDKDKQEFMSIIKQYINKDSEKIAEIFNLPELTISIKEGKSNYKPIINEMKTNNPITLLISLIAKIEIARELATKRQLSIYNEKGIKQDNLIMIDYFNTYSNKLFKFLVNHHNLYNIRNFTAKYFLD